jgi:hypothetical protein
MKYKGSAACDEGDFLGGGKRKAHFRFRLLRCRYWNRIGEAAVSS